MRRSVPARRMNWLQTEMRIRALVREADEFGPEGFADFVRCLDAIVADETGRGSSLPDVDDVETRRLCNLYPGACGPWYQERR